MTEMFDSATLPRILIVDDDPATIRILAQVVSEQGHVLFATSGADAIVAARDERPDLILLDAQMDGMDGFEACVVLRSLPDMGDVPILFVTANRDVASEMRALEVGAVDFIAKPFHPAIVQARVRTHLTLKQRTDALRRLATIDGLTGIANRRHFDARLQQEVRRISRSHSPLSVALVDVDHFKRFNDHYGHQAGDDCLRNVASALASTVRRADDLAARFGGEEFAILLPGCPPEQGMSLAEALRRAVFDLGLPHAASPTAEQVTISVGVATLAPPLAEPEAIPIHIVSLIGAADRALYQAKAAGRNAVRRWPMVLQPA